MSEAVTIIVDDTDLFNGATFNSAAWTELGTSSSKIKGLPTFNTSLALNPDGQRSRSSFTFSTDEITSLALFGFTPVASNDQTFSVHIQTKDSDIGSWTNSYPSPDQGCQFFTTPNLPATGGDSTFFFDVSTSGGLSIDYAVMEVTNSTDLTGKTIIVDDSSPEITWQGNWQSHSFDTTIQISFDVDPVHTGNTKGWHSHGNSTHRSISAGDSFIFQFAGTSITVAGIFPVLSNQPDVFFNLNFTVDNLSIPSSFTQSDVADSQVKSRLIGGRQIHFPWFTNNSLTPGVHTLIVEVLNVGGLDNNFAVEIDYLTYTPSFRTASEKPNFGNGSGSGNPSGNPSGTLLGPNPTTTGSPSPPTTKGTNIGAVIGGVVASVVLLVGLIGGYLFWRYRRKQHAAHLLQQCTIIPNY
ncbi:hypothetical protein K435DRAFT_900932 [Dendrothele bispora CBS 962.96]|uniref:Uncharacterized protein n=1 Tax=Dendrothele bispora (strain CBS 962.96) TaxID=1314807 RepID=A0A4S8LY61_DENBC|nr:hypothetical protein K435DRAFT_900932 [Dendrothele bispora CBS 962.96]